MYSHNDLHQGSLLLIWFNLNLSMDNELQVGNEKSYPFPNFNGTAVEASERTSNFISHFTWRMISYSCWDLS